MSNESERKPSILGNSSPIAVLSWCENLRLRFGDTIPRAELEKGVRFAQATGGVIHVIGPQGILKPKDFQLPLDHYLPRVPLR